MYLLVTKPHNNTALRLKYLKQCKMINLKFAMERL